MGVPTSIPLNSYRRIASLAPPPPPLGSSVQIPTGCHRISLEALYLLTIYILYHHAGSRVSVRDLSRAITTPPDPLSGGRSVSLMNCVSLGRLIYQFCVMALNFGPFYAANEPR